MDLALNNLQWLICHTIQTKFSRMVGGNVNEGVLCIPQSSIITGTLPSYCFELYPGHSMGWSYLSVEMQSVYSTATAEGACNRLLHCSKQVRILDRLSRSL